LRLATWNIHGGVGLDRRFDPDRIARVIEELDVPVVALQEFHARRGFALRDHLERASGSTAVVASTFVKHGGDFGNAVLSALPIEAVTVHDLGVAGREPRNAIDLVMSLGGARRVRVVATHLGLRAGERAQQIERLARSLAAEPTSPTVLLGDFNEWRHSGGGLRAIDGVLAPARSLATFPSPRALLALDRVWASPSLRATTQVHRSRLARIASDHLPLVVTIEWGDAA
jgi:endonuclease/exonuclease/phosphatase family metal-dependent hydrolase